MDIEDSITTDESVVAAYLGKTGPYSQLDMDVAEICRLAEGVITTCRSIGEIKTGDCPAVVFFGEIKFGCGSLHGRYQAAIRLIESKGVDEVTDIVVLGLLRELMQELQSVLDETTEMYLGLKESRRLGRDS